MQKKQAKGYQYSLFDINADDIKPAVPESLISGGTDFRRQPQVRSELDQPIVDLHEYKTLKYISFGSGSSGNCSYLGNDDGGILVDAGVDIKHVIAELEKNGIAPESIKGICLTHDHGDHIRYVYSFLRKYKTINLFCTNRVLTGILRKHNISRRIKDYHVAIYKEIPFKLAGFEITAFEVSHDGSCNSGFSIAYNNRNFVIATDMGKVTERAHHYISEADYLMLESNYDAKMLDNGTYPEYLKSRIRSEIGHLDNEVAAALLAEIYSKRLKYVFLCHLSKDNNTPEIARATIVKALTGKGISVGEGEETLVDRTKDVQLVVLPRYDATRCYKFRIGI